MPSTGDETDIFRSSRSDAVAGFFVTFNTLAAVLIFILLSLYINNVIIKFRLNELDSALMSVSDEGEQDHTMSILARFQLVKNRRHSNADSEDALKQEVKFQSLMSHQFLDDKPVDFNGVDRAILKIVSGIRFVLGKDELVFNVPDEYRFELEKAYYLERMRKYEEAIEIYEKFLKRQIPQAQLKASVYLHYGFCKSFLGEYNNAIDKLNMIVEDKVFSGSQSWKVAWKMIEEINILKENAARVKDVKVAGVERGRQLFMMGNSRKAIDELQMYLDSPGVKGEKRNEGKYLLGRASEDIGENSNAVNEYRDIIQADPASAWAKKANRRLYVMGKFYSGNEKLAEVAKANSRYYRDSAFINDMRVYETIETKQSEQAEQAEQSKFPLKNDTIPADSSVGTVAEADSTDAIPDLKNLRASDSDSAKKMLDSLRAPENTDVAREVMDDLTKDLLVTLDDIRIPKSVEQFDMKEDSLVAVREKRAVVERETETFGGREVLADPIRKQEILSVLNIRSGELKFIYEKYRERGVIRGGVILLRLLISSSGQVVLAEVSRQDPGVVNDGFENELIKSIYKWKFRPVSSSEPDVSISFPVTFVSHNKRASTR